MLAGYLMAGGAAILWGLVYAIDQRLLKDLSPYSLVFLHSVLGIFFIIPLALYQEGTQGILKAFYNWRLASLVLLTVVLSALAGLLILGGIKVLGASRASFFEISYPFFVAFFAGIMFSEKPDGWLAAGGILIFAGSVLIMQKT